MLEFFEDSRMTEQYIPMSKEYNSLPAQAREQLSRDGMRLFVKASKSEPGSITVQGALIAKYCHEEEIENPRLLGDCLVNDSEKIGALISMADKMHTRSGNLDIFVSSEKMRGVIRSDFANADVFLPFLDEELDFIVNNLGKKIKRGNGKSEDKYFIKALQAPHLYTRAKRREAVKHQISETVMQAGKEIILKARTLIS